MKKEMYNKKRSELTALAQKAIDEGKVDEANEAMKQINELDERYENEARAQANLDAMTREPAPINLQNLGGRSEGENDGESITNSLEYRNAFRAYLISGVPMPAKFKDATTTTADVDAVIPEKVVNDIVGLMESNGKIFAKMTKTAIKGGVKVPKATARPVATWVAQGSGSEKQKADLSGTIDFGYWKLRCAVATTIEVQTMALEVFEKWLAKAIADAMVKAIEQAAINGNGTDRPKGVLSETVMDGQNVDVPAAGIDYKTICDVEGALPEAYENSAEWTMSKKTFMAMQAITDENGQPVARTNYGLAGKIERTLLGRDVNLTEHMPANIGDTVAEDTVVAFLFNWADYMFNSNMGITMKTYEDNDTDDVVKKAIMLADGKAVDKGSLVTLTKKKA